MSESVEVIVTTRSALAEIVRQEISAHFQQPVKEKEPADLGGVEVFEEVTGLARQTAYYKHHRKEFPPGICFKRGNRLYFSRKALQAWIQGE